MAFKPTLLSTTEYSLPQHFRIFDSLLDNPLFYYRIAVSIVYNITFERFTAEQITCKLYQNKKDSPNSE
jgi:hypothetical protein